MTKIVIVGAGIVGFYTAFCLLERGVDARDITIVAEYLPGDESVKYTSPYAGGNFSCITGDDPDVLEYDRLTYTNLAKVQKAIGGKTKGLDRYKSTEIWDFNLAKCKIDSLKSYLQEYHEIDKSQLPSGAAFGITFLSWNFNCPKFLMNFKIYLEQQGVQVVRKHLGHIVQAYGPDTKLVFNCTGLGARSLGGVEDKNMYPARGQVVVIKAPHIMENVMRWGNEEPTYIIKRPYSHDQLILGGFYQRGDWTSDTLKEQSDDVLQRTTQLFPKILTDNPHGNKIEDLEVIRVVAGLRPGRHGGTRIEKEKFDEGKVLVHNYGAGGYGYQAGLGMAYKAVQLALNGAKL
ncbi:IFG3 [Candida margitis]|uniref:IFG3 n=1 Tax=Candida margitis TaxID=1775924 RepID=UPI002225CE9A|nr:IFG3 [Candida margitis]KAI5968007.1 IFG3 [Candida margitis]